MRQQMQQQNLGMQGGLNAQQANLHAMDAAGLGSNAAQQLQLANMTPEQQMQRIQQQQLQNLGNPYQAQLGGPQGGMQQSYQAALANQQQSNNLAANQFGGQGGAQPQNSGFMNSMLAGVPGFNSGMSAPPGQQVGMFGGGAPMPQQQAPAGANFGVGPFGPGMGVQGGMGTGMQGMSVGAPPAGMANQQRYTPR
jgi:hypothetical protein